jgi:CheY-like chemotaxis protein
MGPKHWNGWSKGQFEILVVDWEMPVLDGADLVRLMRRPEHLYCFAPIIMITGHSTYRRTQEALALGVNDVLCKPFSPRALYLRIADSVLKPPALHPLPQTISAQDHGWIRDNDPLILGVSPWDVGSTRRAVLIWTPSPLSSDQPTDLSKRLASGDKTIAYPRGGLLTEH